jgi:hypothetical protein
MQGVKFIYDGFQQFTLIFSQFFRFFIFLRINLMGGKNKFDPRVKYLLLTHCSALTNSKEAKPKEPKKKKTLALPRIIEPHTCKKEQRGGVTLWPCLLH